jgi:hypothetical protein
MEFRSDAQGRVSFSPREGSHVLHMEKTHYAPLTDTLDLRRDTSLLYLMEALVASVKIRLREESTPVNKATVRLNGLSQETGSLGTATFPDLETGITYAYGVEKEGYASLEGHLKLLADTVLDLQFSKATALDKHSLGDRFRAWPNPVSQVLNLQIARGSGPATLVLCDMQGRTLLEASFEEGNHQLDLGVYPQGAYVLRYRNATCSHSTLLLKRYQK